MKSLIEHKRKQIFKHTRILYNQPVREATRARYICYLTQCWIFCLTCYFLLKWHDHFETGCLITCQNILLYMLLIKYWHWHVITSLLVSSSFNHYWKKCKTVNTVFFYKEIVFVIHLTHVWSTQITSMRYTNYIYEEVGWEDGKEKLLIFLLGKNL